MGERKTRLPRLRRVVAAVMREGLAPGRAAAAVFLGVFIGIVPIYGFQSVVAIALAAAFGLNKPLTFAATFINNPLLQPWLILSGLELGHLVRQGRWLRLSLAEMAGRGAQGFGDWLFGTMLLAVLLASAAGLFTYVAFRAAAWKEPRGVNALFARCGWYDRGFVRWKMRLDRIFSILAEEIGPGPVIDLGCGYGAALAVAALREPGRKLAGCDLDAHRIEAARRALEEFSPELEVADIRAFPLSPAGTILIIDVLQYLDRAEQTALLERCCSAVLPGGKLIFRVPDPERGLASRLSALLDRLVFRLGGCHNRPNVLPADEYRRLLEAAGMEVCERRLINRLPLAHVVFVARRADARVRGRPPGRPNQPA